MAEWLTRLGGASLMLASACADRTPTSELSASVAVTMRDQGLRVEILLVEGYTAAWNFPRYAIEPDEHVLVRFRDQVLDLLYLDGPAAYDTPTYRADFGVSGDVTADDRITVTLDRGGDDKVVLAVELPTPFTLDAPPIARTGQDLVVRWSPTTTEPMGWITYDCTFSSPVANGPIPEDAGVITFPRSLLRGESCDLDFGRSHVTAPKSVFRSAQTHATLWRTAAITFTP